VLNKNIEDLNMVYLILVAMLNLGTPATKTTLIDSGTITFQIHNSVHATHSNTIKYVKAPTHWVKVVNN
tara:strand:- start:197 stop:403 length:207 start_codon:yes stop_codon:yes gene_type:complete